MMRMRQERLFRCFRSLGWLAAGIVIASGTAGAKERPDVIRANWSPDEKRVAILRSGGHQNSLMIRDLRSGRVWREAQPGRSAWAWGAHGSSVVYVVPPKNSVSIFGTLVEVKFPRARPRVIDHDVLLGRVFASPDGWRFAYVRSAEPHPRRRSKLRTVLWIYDARSGRRFPASDALGIVWDSAAWSPDGSAVAFVANDREGATLPPGADESRWSSLGAGLYVSQRGVQREVVRQSDVGVLAPDMMLLSRPDRMLWARPDRIFLCWARGNDPAMTNNQPLEQRIQIGWYDLGDNRLHSQVALVDALPAGTPMCRLVGLEWSKDGAAILVVVLSEKKPVWPPPLEAYYLAPGSRTAHRIARGRGNISASWAPSGKRALLAVHGRLMEWNRADGKIRAVAWKWRGRVCGRRNGGASVLVIKLHLQV